MKGKILLIGIVALILFSGCPKPPESYCEEPGVTAVYSCEAGLTKVVSEAGAAGYRLEMGDGSKVQCPVVAPEDLPEYCRRAMEEGFCSENNLCQ